jgi:predicted aspartyl protease
MVSSEPVKSSRPLNGKTPVAILLAVAGLLGGSGPSASAARKAEFEALPLSRTEQNHLLVHAYINNRPALLVVDTGSPTTVVTTRRGNYFRLTNAPAKLNWPREVQVNGSMNSLVIARQIKLGALTLVDTPVVLADIGGARHLSRSLHLQEIDGILGADALAATQAVVDCEKQLLFLNLYPDAPGRVPGLDVRGFQSMPMLANEGMNYYVDGSINGRNARLMVDTGAFATLLNRRFISQLHIPTEETRLQSARLNLKNDDVDVARIRKLSIGMIDIENKRFGVTDLAGVLHNAPGDDGRPAVGLLGGEILHRNQAIIDFGSRTLYLKREAGEPNAGRPVMPARSRRADARQAAPKSTQRAAAQWPD